MRAHRFRLETFELAVETLLLSLVDRHVFLRAARRNGSHSSSSHLPSHPSSAKVPPPLSPPPASRALGTWAGKQRGGGCAWRGGGGDDGVSEPPETPPAGASSRARAARAHWRGRPVSKVPGSERMRTWPRGDVTILAHNNSASVARTRSARPNNNNGAGMRVGRRSSLGAEVVISPIDRVPRPRPARRPTAPRPPS